MELWRIGDSLPAPKFNVISSPNNWAKAVRSSQNLDTLSDSNIFQLDFWKGFSDFLISHKSSLKPRKPRGQHWYDFSIGSSQAHIGFIVSVKDNFIRCDFYIPDNKNLFKKLLDKKSEIESKLGFEMDWQELPNAKASRIAIQKNMKDIKSNEETKQAYSWYKEVGEKIFKTFQEYL